MVVADIDIGRSIEHKMAHDIVGSYNRFDIFHVEIDPTPNRPLWIKRPSQRAEEVDDWSQMSETEDATSRDDRQAVAEIRRTKA
jgi:hypothetical protein